MGRSRRRQRRSLINEVKKNIARKRGLRTLSSKRKKIEKNRKQNEENVKRKKFLGEALMKDLRVKIGGPTSPLVAQPKPQKDNLEDIQTV